MKIDDAVGIATGTAKAVLEDMARDRKAESGFGTMMFCFRGDDPVAMMTLPPNRETLLQTAFLAARGFGPDLLAVSHDTYIAVAKDGEWKDPRTGKPWATPVGDVPGPLQTYIEEFGYDGTVVDCLVTHAVNRAGDASVEILPYVVDGRFVRWLDLGQGLDRSMYRDDGVQQALQKMMGMTTLDQVMPGLLPDRVKQQATSNPEVARWSYDMATVAIIEDGVDTRVDVRLFAEPGSPRHQLFRSKFSRSQIIDPSRWN